MAGSSDDARRAKNGDHYYSPQWLLQLHHTELDCPVVGCEWSKDPEDDDCGNHEKWMT